MKQQIPTLEGRAALREQLGAPGWMIEPDSELLNHLFAAKAVSFWEGTCASLDNAEPLLREGLAALEAVGGWETQGAALLVYADESQRDLLSLAQVDALAGAAMESAPEIPFTFGTAMAALDIGILRLALLAAEEPVRAPERLTRLVLGSLTLLAGGSADDRAEQLDGCMTGADFADSLAEASMIGGLDEFRADWCTLPEMQLSEAHAVEGKTAAEEMLSGILLERYYNDLPSVLTMQYLPQFLAKWFPMDRMDAAPV